jgi:fumarate hydratase class II
LGKPTEEIRVGTGDFRIEKDSLGELKVPADAYYGVQTMRAVGNFPISGRTMPAEFIRAMVMIKKAAAVVNGELGLLPKKLSRAIVKACDEILKGKGEFTPGRMAEHFPVDVYQTGSGTSTNMNVNEVIASRANEILGGKRGDKLPVHPNDHVNMGQSSNDVVPTAMQVMAAVMIQDTLINCASWLHGSLTRKSHEFWGVIKTGRTHLQDATPIRLGHEFFGYADQMTNAEIRGLVFSKIQLQNLPLGGTAVGTGINAHPKMAARVCKLLASWTNVRFKEASNHFWPQATLDTAVYAHSGLKGLAISLVKICNDIRWMSSGPRAGLGEIELPAVQPGSSIMPGQVNPVICESVLMVCQRVLGNDAAMTAAATSANFELAMSMPLAAMLLHESITLLAAACKNLATQCIDGIKATPRGPELVEKGLMLATALVPAIGYEKAAEIAKEAAKSGRTIREVAREKSGLSEKVLTKLLDVRAMVGDTLRLTEKK